MTASRIAEFPKGKLFVVYCAGPHCNGANKAALRLARLGLPVKMMIGGITGWLDEGFPLAAATPDGSTTHAYGLLGAWVFWLALKDKNILSVRDRSQPTLRGPRTAP